MLTFIIIHVTGPDDPHAGLLTLANTATALTSSQPDNMTSSQGDSQKTDSDGTVTKTTKSQSGETSSSQDNSSASCSNVTSLSSTVNASGVTSSAETQQSTTNVTQSPNTNAPIMSTNQLGPGLTNTVGSVTGPPPLVPGSQAASSAPTLIQLNGQLLLVPPAGQPASGQPGNTDNQSQEGSQPSITSTGSNTSTVLPSMSTSSTTSSMPSGVPVSMGINQSQMSTTQTPNMAPGAGMRMPGIMGLPGSVPGQMLGNPLGPQHQIVIGPNGQPMLLQNTQQTVPNTPMFSQPQPSSDVSSLATTNQMSGGPAGANQNMLGMSAQPTVPNQLPNALILPNGQVSYYNKFC